MIKITEDKTQEVEYLKNQIAILVEDIKKDGDEETLKKIKMFEDKFNINSDRFKTADVNESFDDINRRLSYYQRFKHILGRDINPNYLMANRLNNFDRRLSYYQRFKHAFERDVDIDPGRLMGLTDGIFGMVMTLLIFGMGLPEMVLLSESDFLAFISSIAPTVGVTLVSFILLASFWLYHHEFIKINNLNIPYLWINMFYLACISFIPFTTSIIGSYSQFFTAEVIFGINIFLTILFFVIMFRYAYHKGFLENKPSEDEKSYIYHTFYIIMALTIVVNLLDFNVSNNFIYLFFLVPVISTIRDIRFKMK